MKIKSLMVVSLLCGFLMLSVIPSVFAQSTFQIDTANSRIWVEGSSTLKDWTAEVNDWEGSIVTKEDGTVESVSVKLSVKSMDGGRGPDMNAKIYKALKAEQQPTIEFNGEGTGDGLATTGAFKMAGQEKEITLAPTGTLASGLKGNHAMKLSDFDIEPPTALFGTIVTYDDVSIVFDITLLKK
ncbi:MAG: YceI family protein [Saprospiraceae bacterium]|nr:YceI family protein [Saprospiraceae bacterium]